MEEGILTSGEWAKLETIFDLMDERDQEKNKQSAEKDQKNCDRTVEQYNEGVHDRLISLVQECQERQVFEMQKNPNPLTSSEIAEELLSLPAVKRLGFTKEQLEELVVHVRKSLSVGLYTSYEQGLGGLELAYQLGLDEDEWRAKDNDLTELFNTIFQKI